MLALLFPPPPPPPLSPPSPPSPTPQPPAVVLRPGLRLGWEADVRGDAATISITSINITASIISSTSQTNSVNNEQRQEHQQHEKLVCKDSPLRRRREGDCYHLVRLN